MAVKKAAQDRVDEAKASKPVPPKRSSKKAAPPVVTPPTAEPIIEQPTTKLPSQKGLRHTVRAMIEQGKSDEEILKTCAETGLRVSPRDVRYLRENPPGSKPRLQRAPKVSAPSTPPDDSGATIVENGAKGSICEKVDGVLYVRLTPDDTTVYRDARGSEAAKVIIRFKDAALGEKRIVPVDPVPPAVIEAFARRGKPIPEATPAPAAA